MVPVLISEQARKLSYRKDDTATFPEIFNGLLL